MSMTCKKRGHFGGCNTVSRQDFPIIVLIKPEIVPSSVQLSEIKQISDSVELQCSLSHSENRMRLFYATEKG